jgi:ABC-type bacteriocin/lantibiotic exporter with double-glycine peptidase domain
LENIEKVISLYPPYNRPDPCSLLAQLEILFDMCIKKGAANMQDVMQVSISCKDVLRQAFTFCQLIFTAGYSVATNERKFSILKNLKNFQRSTLTEDRLESLMVLKSEKDIADEIDMEPIIKKWAQLKNRRVNLGLK